MAAGAPCRRKAAKAALNALRRLNGKFRAKKGRNFCKASQFTRKKRRLRKENFTFEQVVACVGFGKKQLRQTF